MFGTLGGPELFLIFVVALIVFGPRKLPEIGKSLGRMMSEFRRASNEFKSTIESEVESEKIRESMRIEAPKVTKAKASPPGAAAKTNVAEEATTDGGGQGEKEPSPPSPSTSPSRSTSQGESGGDDGTPTSEGRSEGDHMEAEARPPASVSTSDTEPATVSRQPPASESK
jgi:Tat protein translocase TatB subunit